MTDFQAERKLWDLAEKAIPHLPEANRGALADDIARFRETLARKEAAAAIAPIASAAPSAKAAGTAALEAGGKSLSGHLMTAGKVTAGIVATAVLLNAWENHRIEKKMRSWTQRIDDEQHRSGLPGQAR